MSANLPVVALVRHGETAWSLSGQHTGLTDLPLTEQGEREARNLALRLQGRSYALVLTSPLKRAVRTCELAGFGAAAQVDRDLVEWDYGSYEGLTSREISATRPGWSLFDDGCPGGETLAAVGARADRVAQRVRAVAGNVLLFSSGHFLRVLAARWLGEDAAAGRHFVLGTAAICTLGYDHDRSEPVIRSWNQVSSGP
ncbi:MAG: histidine phosphatase family protein [Betaproteobacteria bacterium]